MKAPKTDAIASAKVEIVKIVGEPYLIDQDSEKAAFEHEWRGHYRNLKAAFVAVPGNTQEVSSVVKICNRFKIPMIPQGGNTGLVAAGVPHGEGSEVIISVKRLKSVRSIDPLENTIVVDAGCTLQQVQDAADDADRLFPLSIGSQGTCQIGGNIGSNAGGITVLRYGNMRELVLGLEVVLPDGEIWHGLRRLRKDNTGYDLKQLFIGGEGTLGVVTAAVLKLFPKPAAKITGFLGLESPHHALQCLSTLRESSGEWLTSFEIMPRAGVELVIENYSACRDPLPDGNYPWYVLFEIAPSTKNEAFQTDIEAILAEGFEEELILDAVIAQSEQQSAQLWQIRETLVEAQKIPGASIKHDVSVPVSKVPEFLERAYDVCQKVVPGCRPLPFGHLGDGNIHYNVSQPADMKHENYMEFMHAMNEEVHNIVVELGGSISAEHGIGYLKIAENLRFKPEIEVTLMRKIKKALDPDGLMNPGKMVPID
jgi:FAD/FMN-containing dehydrogenase